MGCFTCRFSERGVRGRFEGMCYDYPKCSCEKREAIFEKCPIGKMEDLLCGISMPKFLFVEEYENYRYSVMDYIKIMKDEMDNGEPIKFDVEISGFSR